MAERDSEGQLQAKAVTLRTGRQSQPPTPYWVVQPTAEQRPAKRARSAAGPQARGAPKPRRAARTPAPQQLAAACTQSPVPHQSSGNVLADAAEPSPQPAATGWYNSGAHAPCQPPNAPCCFQQDVAADDWELLHRIKALAAGEASSALLAAAVHGGDAALVSLLVRAGADALCETSEGCSVLHLAAQLPSTAVIEALLAAGASVDSRDEAGLTPLNLAAAAGQLDNVCMLLRAGAGPSPQLGAQLAPQLKRAAAEGCLEKVQALHAAGVRLGADNTLYGGEALLLASQAGDLARVHCWLAAVVDPNQATDDEGHTALHLGVEEPEVVAALVAAGADCHAAAHGLHSPLRTAAEDGHEASLRAMLAAGAALQLEATAKAALLGVALEAGMQGAFLAELVPLGGTTPARLWQWAAAAGAEHAPWLRAGLLALHRARLPAEAVRRVPALALL